MKKVLEISLAGIPFTIEEDAYIMLKGYFSRFENTISDINERKEVMEDIEARAAEIFQNEFKYSGQIIDVNLVEILINCLGEVGDSTKKSAKSSENTQNSALNTKQTKRFYRDPDDKKIGGVCSGIAAYLDCDVTLVRVIFLVALIIYGSTLWIYLIFWIATKEAKTISQRLEMRGIPVTAENIKNYSAQFSQSK